MRHDGCKQQHARLEAFLPHAARGLILPLHALQGINELHHCRNRRIEFVAPRDVVGHFGNGFVYPSAQGQQVGA